MSTTSGRVHRVGPVGDIVRSNIMRLLEERRISRAELISRVQSVGRRLDFLALRRIEHGERRVDVDDLAAIATALGTTAAQLLRPPTECTMCHGTPPSGFACNDCGAGAPTPEPPSGE